MLIGLLAHAGESTGWHIPPLHPILVNFTAALIPASVLSDVLGRWLKRDSFHKAAWWMLLYAVVITPFTAAAGWWWMRDMEGMNDWRLPVHMWLGFSMAAVAIALALWRGRFYRKQLVPGLAYLLVAGLGVGALTVQGELGGQMSFGSMEAESSHAERNSSRDSKSHNAATGSPSPDTQPAAQPDAHQHHHENSSGSLQWRDHIDLNG